MMTITTTPHLEGHRIVLYLDIVSGEAVVGANFVKDFFAGIRDIVGGRSRSYEQVLREAREQALREMQEQAAILGANAVVGVDIDYETLGARNGMMMVTACGTAVIVEKVS